MRLSSIARLSVSSVMPLLLLLSLFVSTGETAVPAEKVKVIWNALSGFTAPIWIGKEAGIYEKYGLDVDLQYVPANTAIQALISGDAPISQVPPMSVVNAILGGADLKLFIGAINTMAFSLMVSPEIKSIEDLRGKAIGVSQHGSSTDHAIRIALTKKWNMRPNKDVNILAMGDLAAIVAGLLGGKIQAGVIGPPQTLQAQQAGFRELVDLGSLGLPYPHMGMATSTSTIRKNPELLRKYTKAFVESVKIFKTDKALSMRVIGKYNKITDPQILQASYEGNRYLEEVPYVKGVRESLGLLAEANSKALTANADEFIENRFVRELEESGFIKQVFGR